MLPTFLEHLPQFGAHLGMGRRGRRFLGAILHGGNGRSVYLIFLAPLEEKHSPHQIDGLDTSESALNRPEPP
jgi:hypothetical protein